MAGILAFLSDPERAIGVAFIIDKGEIELLMVEVGTRHLHFDDVAESVFVVVFPSRQAIVFLVVVVVVVGKIAHGHKTLALAVVEFDIESPFRHARDDTLINLPETVAHIFHLLISDRSPLRIGGELLHVGGMLALVSSNFSLSTLLAPSAYLARRR